MSPAAESVAAEAEKQQAAEGGEHPEAYQVLPFFRTPTSDINTTLALALITMFMVQVFGVRALGGRYFFKFVNIPELRRGGLGIMMFIVGFLELISEIARILSFTFRLLGNIFAGGVLLLVMTFIVPFFIPDAVPGTGTVRGLHPGAGVCDAGAGVHEHGDAEPRRSRRGTSLNLDFDVGAAFRR